MPNNKSKQSLKGGKCEQCYKCCALQKTCLHTQPPSIVCFVCSKTAIEDQLTQLLFCYKYIIPHVLLKLIFKQQI